jgi:hypothetical protein
VDGHRGVVARERAPCRRRPVAFLASDGESSRMRSHVADEITKEEGEPKGNQKVN